jgi:hypothetical protein
MKRINLAKYGFIRDETHDFSDDGSRFYVYRAGKRVRVSKCTYNGQVYISARIDGCKLTWDEYSKLSYYKSLDALNGVSIDTLTEEDLIRLYQNCLAYEKEYDKAEKTSVFPTKEELVAKYERVKAVRELELKNITERATVDFLLSLDKYTLDNFAHYYKELKKRTDINPEALADSYLNTAYSKTYCWSTQDEDESYYYNRLVEYLENKK